MLGRRSLRDPVLYLATADDRCKLPFNTEGERIPPGVDGDSTLEQRYRGDCGGSVAKESLCHGGVPPIPAGRDLIEGSNIGEVVKALGDIPLDGDANPVEAEPHVGGLTLQEERKTAQSGLERWPIAESACRSAKEQRDKLIAERGRVPGLVNRVG